MISAGNILSQHCVEDAHSGPLLQKKLRVLRENISETNFPGVTCLLVQETQDCIRCEKYFIKFTILKMHKFCHRHRFMKLFRKIEFFLLMAALGTQSKNKTFVFYSCYKKPLTLHPPALFFIKVCTSFHVACM